MEFIQAEVRDRGVDFDMNTAIDALKIDSIDVINVIFKVEDEFRVALDLPPDARFATVGDFVGALADFVPAAGKA